MQRWKQLAALKEENRTLLKAMSKVRPFPKLSTFNRAATHTYLIQPTSHAHRTLPVLATRAPPTPPQNRIRSLLLAIDNSVARGRISRRCYQACIKAMKSTVMTYTAFLPRTIVHLAWSLSARRLPFTRHFSAPTTTTGIPQRRLLRYLAHNCPSHRLQPCSTRLRQRLVHAHLLSNPLVNQQRNPLRARIPPRPI